jgi:aspartyl-tRNA(Asn)/glutamyl-tRNA(Gln) amidotransferase subunit C
MSQLKITVAEVERIAQLARLSPSPEQARKLASELSAILDHVAQLSEVDTNDVPPSAHAVVEVSPLRDDRVVPGLTREQALAAAPRAHDGGFAVPKVLEVES